ncbi:MAG: zf-HC2 domain-containing protein [Planctomycetota bacterium]
MKCEEAIDLLSEYIDDELDVEQREAVEFHVAGCANCRRELDALKATVKLVGSLSRVTAPATLADNVSQTLAEEDRGRIIWPSARVVGSLLAAAAVLLVVSVTFLMRKQTPMAPMESAAPAEKPSSVADVATKETRERELAEVAEEKAAERSSLGKIAKKEAEPELKARGLAEDREADGFAYRDKAGRRRPAAEPEDTKATRQALAEKNVLPATPGSNVIVAPAKPVAELAPAPQPLAKAPEMPVIGEKSQEKKEIATLADRDKAEVRRNEEARKDAALQAAPRPTVEAKKGADVGMEKEGLFRRGGAETKAEAEVQTKIGIPAAPRPETVVAKAKEERELGMRLKAAPAEAQTAPAAEPPRPAAAEQKVGKVAGEVAGKAVHGPAPEAELRTLVIRSRNPQADMERVQSLLQTKYPPKAEGDVVAGRLDAPMQQEEGVSRLQTRIAANQFRAFLGDLKRLNLVVMPQWDERGDAGLMNQPRFAQELEQAAPRPGTIHLTILFQQAE